MLKGSSAKEVDKSGFAQRYTIRYRNSYLLCIYIYAQDSQGLHNAQLDKNTLDDRNHCKLQVHRVESTGPPKPQESA